MHEDNERPIFRPGGQVKIRVTRAFGDILGDSCAYHILSQPAFLLYFLLDPSTGEAVIVNDVA